MCTGMTSLSTLSLNLGLLCPVYRYLFLNQCSACLVVGITTMIFVLVSKYSLEWPSIKFELPSENLLSLEIIAVCFSKFQMLKIL